VHSHTAHPAISHYTTTAAAATAISHWVLGLGLFPKPNKGNWVFEIPNSHLPLFALARLGIEKLLIQNW
jgi:hypothetical protein